MRHDRPNEKSPDKEDDAVKKGFWSGKLLVSAQHDKLDRC